MNSVKKSHNSIFYINSESKNSYDEIMLKEEGSNEMYMMEILFVVMGWKKEKELEPSE